MFTANDALDLSDHRALALAHNTHPGGPRAELSPAAFALLEPTDGTLTLTSLATVVGGLGQDLRHELYALWQQRLLALRPAGTIQRAVS
jgi:hypothetical protein